MPETRFIATARRVGRGVGITIPPELAKQAHVLVGMQLEVRVRRIPSILGFTKDLYDGPFERDEDNWDT